MLHVKYLLNILSLLVSVQAFCFSSDLAGVVLLDSGIEGIFTVGDASSDYESLTSALDALSLNGVCGPVTLNIKSGTYDEKPIVTAIDGLSSVNTLTIQSEVQDSSAVVFESINTNSENYVFRLDEVSFVTLQHLTFRTLSTGSNMIVLSLRNRVGHCNFRRLELSSQSTGGNSSKILFNADNSITNDIHIENCHFKEGGYQVYFSCVTNGTGVCDSILIENNIFSGNSGTAILTEDVNGLTVRANKFSGTKGKVIHITSATSGIVVERNQIEVDGFSPQAIELQDVRASEMDPAIVKNNFVRSTNDGIFLRRSHYCRVVHNNVFSTGSGAALVAGGSTQEDNQFINNVVHSGIDGGRCFNFYGNADIAEISLENNCYYNEDRLIFLVSNVEHSLQEWQDDFDKDASSFSANPKFASEQDLHIDNNLLLNGTAIVLPYVVVDVDDEPRDASAPDMGADEFTLNSNTILDLTLAEIISPNASLCQDQESMTILVTNNSPVAIQSFVVEWKILGLEQTPIPINTSINVGETTEIEIGTYDFAPCTYYDLEITLTQPNGFLDDNGLDNDAEISYYYLDTASIRELEDDCDGSIDLFVKKINNASYEWSTGDSDFKIEDVDAGTYEVTVTDSNQCFIISSITID